MQVPTRAVRYTVDGIEELISEETIHVDFGCEHTTPNVTVKALAQAIEQQAKRSGALLSDSWRLIISSNYQVCLHHARILGSLPDTGPGGAAPRCTCTIVRHAPGKFLAPIPDWNTP